MASFSAGTTFTDGVANDVTAAKLGALVNNATPTSGLIQDRTAETVTATNDTLLIGDASDSNNLKRITVANFAQTLPTAKVTTGTIDTATLGTTTGTAATFTTGTITTLTAGTTTSTAATITTGTIPTLVATTLVTTGTGTASAPAIVPTGDTNTGILFPADDTVAISTQGTERVRVDSSGNVGIGLSPTARNNTRLQIVDGIGFPATRVSSSDANTLDDYEEGTWTPALTTDGTNFSSITYDAGITQGNYTKIGNMVTVYGSMRTDAVVKGSASGNTMISGLPFASTQFSSVAIGQSTGWLANNPNHALVNINDTRIYLATRTTAAGSTLNGAVTDVGTGANANTIYFTVSYPT